VSLPELHQILQDYINRNDDEAADLVKERSERAWRKGEGKSKREVELDNGKIADDSEYRSGFGEFSLSQVYTETEGRRR
jgi:translation machinery-associated protein 16